MEEAGGEPTARCERLHKALCECHKRFGPGATRAAACRHLNRALAECLITVICPEETEAVRTLCGSGGTRLKRSQCQEAQLSLSVCISSHQQQQQED
ncbi:Cytochrome c oxidase biogenesis protein Cmc1-like protein [Corchorus capsularis]|uniref:Cytochrome c oxidase biogenesis protein Cmc1-like protein n=1 Tax=Corchorus capsularis TaxID=210143 RepID=A0A1R3HJD2_COCAP|nr:Cytochrome c oxidase biogenesis protein Cmc1-like protein [Corchorus capsularis]